MLIQDLLKKELRSVRIQTGNNIERPLVEHLGDFCFFAVLTDKEFSDPQCDLAADNMVSLQVSANEKRLFYLRLGSFHS